MIAFEIGECDECDATADRAASVLEDIVLGDAEWDDWLCEEHWEQFNRETTFREAA